MSSHDAVQGFTPSSTTFLSRHYQQHARTNTLLHSTSTLSTEEQHALEVFAKFDRSGTGRITLGDLGDMLQRLDIEATTEEHQALFKYLDQDDDGTIDFLEEFLPWYQSSVEASRELSANFQSLLIGRRTVDYFDQTPVDPQVLRRAIQCAIAAPNRSCSEPWRFIQVGPETVQQLKELNEQRQESMETDNGLQSTVDWSSIPGWCVVTTQLSNEGELDLDDFKSTSCAVQNFMLSMWSEGIGTKWTSGPVQKSPEFAQICGVDTKKEQVVGCIWYGFASGGLTNADPKRRKKSVDDVLSSLP